MTMTRGIAISRRAVQAATSRGDAMAKATPTRGTEGRPVVLTGHDERDAMRRDHAFVEAAATAAIRGARV